MAHGCRTHYSRHGTLPVYPLSGFLACGGFHQLVEMDLGPIPEPESTYSDI
jgi:hypothetical protein